MRRNNGNKNNNNKNKNDKDILEMVVIIIFLCMMSFYIGCQLCNIILSRTPW